MAIYVVLAPPILNGNDETGSKPAVWWPSQVHLMSGALAKPGPNGNILCSQSDAVGLIGSGWTVQASGDDNFLAAMLSSGWVRPPSGGFDGSAAGGS
jgi:hypothetical protein